MVLIYLRDYPDIGWSVSFHDFCDGCYYISLAASTTMPSETSMPVDHHVQRHMIHKCRFLGWIPSVLRRCQLYSATCCRESIPCTDKHVLDASVLVARKHSLIAFLSLIQYSYSILRRWVPSENSHNAGLLSSLRNFGRPVNFKKVCSIAPNCPLRG